MSLINVKFMDLRAINANKISQIYMTVIWLKFHLRLNCFMLYMRKLVMCSKNMNIMEECEEEWPQATAHIKWNLLLPSYNPF